MEPPHGESFTLLHAKRVLWGALRFVSRLLAAASDATTSSHEESLNDIAVLFLEPEFFEPDAEDLRAFASTPRLASIGEMAAALQTEYSHRFQLVPHAEDFEVLLDAVDFVLYHGGNGMRHEIVSRNIPSLIMPHSFDQHNVGQWSSQRFGALVAESQRSRGPPAVIGASSATGAVAAGTSSTAPPKQQDFPRPLAHDDVDDGFDMFRLYLSPREVELLRQDDELATTLFGGRGSRRDRCMHAIADWEQKFGAEPFSELANRTSVVQSGKRPMPSLDPIDPAWFFWHETRRSWNNNKSCEEPSLPTPPRVCRAAARPSLRVLAETGRQCFSSIGPASRTSRPASDQESVEHSPLHFHLHKDKSAVYQLPLLPGRAFFPLDLTPIGFKTPPWTDRVWDYVWTDWMARGVWLDLDLIPDFATLLRIFDLTGGRARLARTSRRLRDEVVRNGEGAEQILDLLHGKFSLWGRRGPRRPHSENFPGDGGE